MLLVHGDVKTASAWVRQGVVPSYVIPLAGWSAVVPGGPSQAGAPYDDAVAMLLARRVPARMRAAIGLFRLDERGVVVVHPRGWRALPRWLVWERGDGVARLPGHPVAAPGDLAMAAGVVPESVRAVREILTDPVSVVDDVLADLMGALALPGERLLSGQVKDAEGAVLVEPVTKAIERFSRVTKEDSEIRAELEQL
ncbi:hypothetical protein EFY87_19245 [Flexivirga caeni]|uniref:Uncharacterized protein n=1 Tax=Flexivirga caeni TaxID=2294115 RepID=A0A3M9LXT1_9MICO|nr:hypothetical protein EFY87_19245 [Flexivirga caeni]